MYKTNKIEITDSNIIQVRQLEVLELANGETREGGYHRYTVTPDADISAIECSKVKAIATATFTPEVVAEYKAKMAEANKELEANQELEA